MSKSTIGYERARNLMRQLNWKMQVSTLGGNVEKIVLLHPEQDHEYTVRLDSGKKLMRECVMQHRIDSTTAILEYNRMEVDVETLQWFAITKWSPEDAMAAAKEQGVTLTKEQAIAWWSRNENRFQNMMVEHGNEVLSNMDFVDES